MANPVQPNFGERAMTKERTVLLAKIGAAHGLKGEVRIKSFTGDPLAFADYGPLRDARGTMFEIEGLRLAKDMVIGRLKSVTSREEAELLNGTELFVDRSQLPQDIGQDEYYQADLVGLKLRDGSGKEYGTVETIHNYGAGDIIEVRGGDRRGTFMIPFTKAAVPEIDTENGVITVDPLAAGLISPDDTDKPHGNRGKRAR
jgi:16S rRNA processing protein RimM